MQQWQQFNFTLTAARATVVSDLASQPDDETIRRTRFRDWIVKVRRLVKVLRQQLDRTVDEFKTFRDTRVVYFQVLPAQDPRHPLLPAIERCFHILAAQRKKLRDLDERCHDFAHDVSWLE